MKKDNDVYLRQIKDYVNDIGRYIKGENFAGFGRKKMLQDAVIRKLGLIGEAARRLSESFVADNPDLPFSEAVATRNKLIHDYEEIDLKIVWNTCKKSLPVLKRKIVSLLKR